MTMNTYINGLARKAKGAAAYALCNVPFLFAGIVLHMIKPSLYIWLMSIGAMGHIFGEMAYRFITRER